MNDPPGWRRLRGALALLAAVLLGGTLGYLALGLSLLDSAYQTVTTVTTVGFREVRPFGPGAKVFTIVLILAGVGTALFTLTVLLETLVEGQFAELLGRRRMDRRIDRMRGHVIVCGYGRVGRELTRWVAGSGQDLVVIDRDAERTGRVPGPALVGDATDEAVLRTAGIERARALVAAIDTDAANLYVTLTARSMNPTLFIIARARVDAAESKMLQAGADRVVNPQAIGGARMAAFVLHPHVAEFMDVVMHDGSLEFRLEEVEVAEGSPLAGQTLREAHIRDRTGALVLAARSRGGPFRTNPSPEDVISPGEILIAIGTAHQLAQLVDAARPPS